MNKPIEPGCLALVINDPEEGISVECIEFKAPGFEFRAAGEGTVHGTKEPAWVTRDPDGELTIRASRTLLRIDGGGAESAERIAESQEVPA